MKAAIFVIDDQRNVAEATAKMMRSHGHDVVVETDSRKALGILLSEREFDVTFLDVLMPGLTGSQVYNVLKERGPARLERLVFYTGMGALAETWLRHTGLPVVEKGTTDSPQELLQWVRHFAELDCSRGPMPYKKPTHSRPEITSDAPSSLDYPGDPPTGVTLLARGGDILAVKLKHLENGHRDFKDETNSRLDKLEGHFEEKGMVSELASDVKIAKSWIKGTPWLIGMIFTIITTAAGGVMYMIHNSEREHDLKIEQQRHEELLQRASKADGHPIILQ